MIHARPRLKVKCVVGQQELAKEYMVMIAMATNLELHKQIHTVCEWQTLNGRVSRATCYAHV